MRKKNRSFLLMSLVAASLLVRVFTLVQAQSSPAPAAKATKCRLHVKVDVLAGT
jgi:hypothetical protein